MENTLLVNLEKTFSDCLETAKKKNNDYAGQNNIDPYKNFRNSVVVGVDIRRGVLVRTMDKISRINNLLDQDAQVKNEAITDTLDDAINYLAILKSMITDNVK